MLCSPDWACTDKASDWGTGSWENSHTHTAAFSQWRAQANQKDIHPSQRAWAWTHGIPLNSFYTHPKTTSIRAWREAHQAFLSGINAPSTSPRDTLDYTPQQMRGRQRQVWGEGRQNTGGRNEHKTQRADQETSVTPGKAVSAGSLRQHEDSGGPRGRKPLLLLQHRNTQEGIRRKEGRRESERDQITKKGHRKK